MRQVERHMAIRLRYTINTLCEDQSLATRATIGAATGLHRPGERFVCYQ